jgi:hypothetical protein
VRISKMALATMLGLFCLEAQGLSQTPEPSPGAYRQQVARLWQDHSKGCIAIAQAVQRGFKSHPSGNLVSRLKKNVTDLVNITKTTRSGASALTPSSQYKEFQTAYLQYLDNLTKAYEYMVSALDTTYPQPSLQEKEGELQRHREGINKSYGQLTKLYDRVAQDEHVNLMWSPSITPGIYNMRALFGNSTLIVTIDGVGSYQIPLTADGNSTSRKAIGPSGGFGGGGFGGGGGI